MLVLLIAGGVTTAVLMNNSTSTAAPPTTVAPTTAAPAPTQTEPPEYAGKLQDLVVPKPASAVLTPSERKGDPDGSMNAQQVASEYSDSGDSNAVLRDLGTLEFRRGVFLAWRDNGTLVYIQIYQFRYEREAVNWMVSVQHSLGGIATSRAVFDEIKDGRWYVTKTPDGRGGAHAIYNKGPFAVMIDTFRAGAADLDGTKKMAVEQFAKLP